MASRKFKNAVKPPSIGLMLRVGLCARPSISLQTAHHCLFLPHTHTHTHTPTTTQPSTTSPSLSSLVRLNLAGPCSQPQHQGSSWARESPANFPRHYHHNHHSLTRSMWCIVVYCCGVGEKGSGVPSGERWREGRTGHRAARDRESLPFLDLSHVY